MNNEPARLEIALLRTARAVRRAFDVRLRDLGLNLSQASLLAFVRDLGPQTQVELAGLLSVSRASVGLFVDALEARSLVKRTSDSNDRRVWRIELTKEAAPLVAAFDETDGIVRSDLRAGLSHDEREVLAGLLLRLERNANGLVDGTLVNSDS